MRKKYIPLKVGEKRAARFWDKVARGPRGSCWPWVGYKKASGHGLTSLGKKIMHAHRAAWLLKRGEIPAGLCVNHKCHNPSCCNPEHMYLGTRAENMHDHFYPIRKRRYRVGKGVRVDILI